ncbi:MAG: phosphotransferase [Chloroflexi bacterium]|nr:phosphotransferase [Chloroflexota bacterium]
MQRLSTDRAQSIVRTVAPGHRLVSVTPARGSFTNDVRILECKTRSGKNVRLVVKFLVDQPVYASRSAVAEFRALRLARAHGVPAPEPIYLDETGSLLGVPGVVTRFVEGRQVADPRNPVEWAETLARLLLDIHEIRPSAGERRHLFDGNDLGLYFLSGDWPDEMGAHPLSSEIFDTVRELRSSLATVPAVLAHMDYWPGNVLWHESQVSAVLDWDFASYGDPALDVAYFRMNMYLRGIKSAADIFLKCYEEESGAVVQNLGFWELATAARPLPDPVLWIPASREMGDAGATDERASTDYYEFVAEARRRAYAGL